MKKAGIKGRGVAANPMHRYAKVVKERAIEAGENEVPKMETSLSAEMSRTLISYNRSPDIPFDRSINPYRGCEHGCVYCFARPTHAFLDLSPGLDFETRLFYKPNAVELLRHELAHPRYQCAPIAVGANTDAYQPVERKLRITRSILEVLNECQHPFVIVTKSALIERDVDILQQAAKQHRAAVAVSVTTLDHALSRKLEPRAATPTRRLQTITALAEAGIPVMVMLAPIIPVLTDQYIERILGAARDAGATASGYVVLRLPHELSTLFSDWLHIHFPLSAQRVLKHLHEIHGGSIYQAEFGTRLRGQGVFAELIRQRFQKASKRLGFRPLPELNCDAFEAHRVGGAGEQLSLF